jgi:predicted DNA-binding transcriptional regulator YafY
MVTAYDHQREEVRIFKIDRIEVATLLDETYTIPAQFSLAQYRGAAFGVLRGYATEAVEIALLFDEESGRWAVEERRDERMTFERQADGSVLVRLTVGITPELVRWVLWYGPHCRVLAPNALREQVRALAEQMAALYRPRES